MLKESLVVAKKLIKCKDALIKSKKKCKFPNFSPDL